MRTDITSIPKRLINMPESRYKLLVNWLEEQGYRVIKLEPASQDASFRSYYRMTQDDTNSLIIMDAPPEKESLSPFIEIAKNWKTANINVPRIYAVSRDNGFMLIEDFGVETFLDSLDKSNTKKQYQIAIDELINIQKYQGAHKLPVYAEGLLMSEMQLFSEWFLQKNCNYELSRTESEKLQKTFTYLLNTALQQSRVTVHRDYHSRNLMARSNLPHGVIDFQDAVVGPVTYDLVSLLKDCYIKMDNNLRSDLIKYYRDLGMQESLLSADDINNFERYFDLMGVQRHLKAIGIFSRLYHRDGKQAYLSDIPRTASYITELENKYPELGDLVDLLNKVLPGLSLDGKH